MHGNKTNLSVATAAAKARQTRQTGVRFGMYFYLMSLVLITGLIFLAYYHQEDGLALLASEKDQLNQIKEQFLKRIQQTQFAAPIYQQNNNNLRSSSEEEEKIPVVSTKSWAPTTLPTLSPTAAVPPTPPPTPHPTPRPTKKTVTITTATSTMDTMPKSNTNRKRKNPPGSSDANSNKKKKKKKNKARRYAGSEILDIESDWAFHGELPWIEVMPTNKIPLKKDRRVVFHNLSLFTMNRSPGPRSSIPGRSRDLLIAEERLKEHIFHKNQSLADGTIPLDDAIDALYQTCQGPVYLGMATVKDDLYWQLIENFFYTSVRFNFSDCAMIICISDEKCLQQCAEAYFPCYNYQYRAEYDGKYLPSLLGENWEPTTIDDEEEKQLLAAKEIKKKSRVRIPTMEQIAQVKLLLVPKALQRGVSLFLLDLDVGFLHDPVHLVRPFLETPIVDIMVQEDMIFLMNRSRAGWKSWHTEPLPNIGLFLVRGNPKTQLMFDIAWDKYRVMDDDYAKQQPGKDQNHVLDSMRIARGTAAMKYAYYDNNTAPLLDKLVLKHGNVMELGGELLASFLAEKGTIAMHATCYEQSTKVHGLRAAAAFWNPRHYDALTRTITKVLVYISEEQILEEVRALIYLAMRTNRHLIIPNIIGNPHVVEKNVYPDMTRMALVDNEYRLWPGFRVVFLKRTNGRNDLDVDILEPGFYWRIARDYDDPDDVTSVFYHPTKHSLLDIKDLLGQEAFHSATRVVLAPDHITGPTDIKISSSSSENIPEKVRNYREQMTKLLKHWANNSIGIYPQPYSATIQQYRVLPEVKPARQDGDSRDKDIVNQIMQGMRLCRNIFHPPVGNRTCFQVCD